MFAIQSADFKNVFWSEFGKYGCEWGADPEYFMKFPTKIAAEIFVMQSRFCYDVLVVEIV